MKLGASIQAGHRLKEKEVVFWTELRAKETAERATHGEHAMLSSDQEFQPCLRAWSKKRVCRG